MSESKNILCISNTTWEGFYTKSTVQIMSLLAKGNKVLFIEYPFTLKDLISTLSGHARAPVSRMMFGGKRLQTVHPFPGVSVFHLVAAPMFPVEFIKNPSVYNFFLRINTTIYAWSVKKALKKLNMQNPVCINAYNSIYGNKLAGVFDEELLVFYCYDGPNTGRYGPKAVRSDQEFAARADGVIVTSEFLAESMRKFNHVVEVVKNGVDFGLFNKHAKTDVRNKGVRKKIGYIGSIDQRFDTDIVEYAVSNLPDYDFEFTGDLMNKSVAERLSGFSNVRFNPPVKAEEVPGLLRDCDAGLIPYLCNDYTKNIYPLKINEYLSVGVPVILTSFANLPEFSEIVSFTSGKEDFAEAIVREVESDSAEKISSRIAFAAKNSWECRAEQFEELIDTFTRNKVNTF